MTCVTLSYKIDGFLKIYDPNNNEVFVDKHNAIHYENMSEALANSLSNRNYGKIYQMGFGNGGSSIDGTGTITYKTPNVIGQSAALYNQTYTKIVDDTVPLNTDPVNNKLTISHVSGSMYSDILVSCLLDYGDPLGQLAFDTAPMATGDFVFDELGLLANYGTDNLSNVLTKLLTHVIFHPVQKSSNRQIQIDYTVRIQSSTTL